MNSNFPEEERFINLFLSSIIILIFLIFSTGFFFLSSCQYLPEVVDDIEKIADNDAIIIKCDKDCFSKSTDLKVSVEVINKDK